MADLNEFYKVVSDIIDGTYEDKGRLQQSEINEKMTYYNPFDFVEK